MTSQQSGQLFSITLNTWLHLIIVKWHWLHLRASRFVFMKLKFSLHFFESCQNQTVVRNITLSPHWCSQNFQCLASISAWTRSVHFFVPFVSKFIMTLQINMRDVCRNCYWEEYHHKALKWLREKGLPSKSFFDLWLTAVV